MEARDFVRNRSGNVAILACLVAPFLFMLVGLGVDFAIKRDAKVALQNALDSALLAAVHLKTDAERNQIASQYANENFAAKYGAHSLSIAITEGQDGELNGAASITVPNYFGGFFGKPESEIQAIGAVQTRTPPLDVMLVLYKTGSMAGAKMDALKTSAKDLIDQVMVNDKVRFGVVPFARYVNIGMGLRNDPGFAVPNDCQSCDVNGVCTNHVWNGCVGSRPPPYNTRDDNPGMKVPGVLDVACGANPITRLTTDKAALNQSIDALVADGMTYIPSGLMIGWHAVTYRPILPDGKNPMSAQGRDLVRAIVLMTDGQNTASATPGANDHESADVVLANATTAALCANVKDDGIKVYTVAFQVVDPTIKAILDDCASPPADSYDAANSAQLAAAFKSIGDSLTRIHLSK